MKKIVLLALAAGGGWWYFHGGRVMTEESVGQFYQQQAAATLSRNPEALCGQLAPEFHSTSVLITTQGRLRQEADRDESCQAVTEMYDGFEKLGEQMGGLLQLDYDHRIQKLTLSPDSKTAVVETSFSLDVAGSIMNFKGESTDTLIRRNGKVMVLRSEGKTRVTSG